MPDGKLIPCSTCRKFADSLQNLVLFSALEQIYNPAIFFPNEEEDRESVIVKRVVCLAAQMFTAENAAPHVEKMSLY